MVQRPARKERLALLTRRRTALDDRIVHQGGGELPAKLPHPDAVLGHIVVDDHRHLAVCLMVNSSIGRR